MTNGQGNGLVEYYYFFYFYLGKTQIQSQTSLKINPSLSKSLKIHLYMRKQHSPSRLWDTQSASLYRVTTFQFIAIERRIRSTVGYRLYMGQSFDYATSFFFPRATVQLQVYGGSAVVHSEIRTKYRASWLRVREKKFEKFSEIRRESLPFSCCTLFVSTLEFQRDNSFVHWEKKEKYSIKK